MGARSAEEVELNVAAIEKGPLPADMSGATRRDRRDGAVPAVRGAVRPALHPGVQGAGSRDSIGRTHGRSTLVSLVHRSQRGIMKAAIIERPATLVVRDIHEPVVGDYDALCEILYGATCTGTDGHLIHGRFPWADQLSHRARPRERRPGDRAGTEGAQLSDRRPGDAGRHARLAARRVRRELGRLRRVLGIARDHWAMQADGLPKRSGRGSRWNQVLPPHFDPAAATMLTTWRETLSYLTRMGLKAGDTPAGRRFRRGRVELRRVRRSARRSACGGARQRPPDRSRTCGRRHRLLRLQGRDAARCHARGVPRRLRLHRGLPWASAVR